MASDSESDRESGSGSGSESETESEYSPEEIGLRSKVYTTKASRLAAAKETIDEFTELLEESHAEELKDIEEDTASLSSVDEAWDFPKDVERWTEEELQEVWTDGPWWAAKPGWDPKEADEEDWEAVWEDINDGEDPKIEPFYVPYRKVWPAIPDNHMDIQTAEDVVEELDRIEEFLTWVSYVFKDGSSYEGTVWDDRAHGKGVYVAEHGLVKYEGEWLDNDMEGHGVVEVDIPDIEPLPGSKLEAKMRAEGRLIERDFMSPEDREWLEMDVEDMLQLANGKYETPFYENDVWVKHFGKKPEKGRYRYAGQWKHGRMHGCGVYEQNERTLYGRFYFGDFEEEATDCTEEISAMHAGIAEIAAAKARMFVNKPDGMVREERGPFNDPQHAYFYEDEDVWMAPGFIHQFHEVPDYWKRYVKDVDQEREMWLNSFYKAPLRMPMPSELEHWWSQDEEPEFVVLSKEPEPDPEDPSKVVYTEDPVILHTPTGRIINLIDDEEHGVRMFWEPQEGEEVEDPDKPQFLPLGFDDFYGIEEEETETGFQRFLRSVENAVKPIIDRCEKWSEEKRKDSALRMKLIEKERELVEAQLSLDEIIDSLEEEDLLMEEEEEEKEKKKGKMGGVKKESVEQTEGVEAASEEEVEEKTPFQKKDVSSLSKPDKEALTEEKEEAEDEGEDEDQDDGEDEDEDDAPPSSFGSVTGADESKQNGQKGNGPGRSPFSSASLLFASCSLISAVPLKLHQSFSARKDTKIPQPVSPSLHPKEPTLLSGTVSFHPALTEKGRLLAKKPTGKKLNPRNPQSVRTASQLRSLSRILSCNSPRPNHHPKRSRAEVERTKESSSWPHAAPETDSDCILSMHTQIPA